MPRSDAQLLGDADPDGHAFEEFVVRHHDALRGYILRRLGPNEADAVLNDVFLTAYRTRDRFRSEADDARPWLFGIATNLIRRERRAEARALRAFAASAVDPVAPHVRTPDVAVSAEVAAALQGMRPKHRDALFLHAVAELSIDEIAVAMDVAPGTVKSWLHRARAHARRALETNPTTDAAAPAASTETNR